MVPIALNLLVGAQIISSVRLRAMRCFAIIGIFAVAAVMTPVDPISQSAMALLAALIYEFSLRTVACLERLHAAIKEDAD